MPGRTCICGLDKHSRLPDSSCTPKGTTACNFLNTNLLCTMPITAMDASCTLGQFLWDNFGHHGAQYVPWSGQALVWFSDPSVALAAREAAAGGFLAGAVHLKAGSGKKLTRVHFISRFPLGGLDKWNRGCRGYCP